MKVHGLHGDVRVKGVFVEHVGVMSNVKVVREGHVLKVFNLFLKSNHVPFPRIVFFNTTFSAPSRPRIPAQYAETCLLKQTVRTIFVENGSKAWHFLKSSDASVLSQDQLLLIAEPSRMD